jgi:hypothetical protein
LSTKKYKILLFLFSIFSANCTAQQYILDNTFQPNYDFNFQVGTINDGYVFPNGSILLFGDFVDYNFPYWDRYIVKLFSSGTVDTSFKPNPFSATGGEVTSVGKNEYGQLIIETDYEFLLKIDTTGLIDTIWSTNANTNFVCTPYIADSVYSDNFFIGLDSCNFNSNGTNKVLYFTKYFSNGKIDSLFTHSTNLPVRNIYKYNNSHLILTGWFTKYDTIQRNYICRIDTSGEMDTTFNSIFRSGFIVTCYVQSDQKVIVSGRFQIYGNPDTLGLIRLNVDGSLDTTFNNGNQIKRRNSIIGCSTICPTYDHGYLIGGVFDEYQHVQRNRIAKIDANGFLSFNSFNGSAIDSAIQITPFVTKILRDESSQKYFVMGYFNRFNGQLVQPIIRLIENPLSINEYIQSELKFSIFPNPLKNSLNILFKKQDDNISNFIDYEILNEFGLIIQSKFKIYFSTEIDLSDLSIGVYLLKIRNAHGSFGVKRFVKLE